MYLGIAILCVAIVPGTFCNEDIHTFMSPEEVQQVFHADDVHSVPEYEVVKLHISERLHKRSLPAGSRIHTKAFGTDIDLWLNPPTDSILAGVDTPVYYAKYSPTLPQNVEYRQRHGLMGMIGRIFEDPRKRASLVIGKDNTGRTRVNGFVESHSLAIRSLPQHIADEYIRRRRSVDDFEDSQYSPYHVVIKMNTTFEENHPRSPVNETRLHERLSRSVIEVPDTLYPEILVVVDFSVYTTYNTFTEYGYDIYGLLEYLLAFWNGVDLKYRSLETPRVRLNIAGIVISEDAYATPYIGGNMLSETAFNSTKAMPQAKKFYYGVKDTFPFDSYDAAATMTRLRFGINSGAVGLSWVGVICERQDRFETNSAVTIFYDNGAFTGVHNAAHELGHLLGAHNDASEFAPNCVTGDGFLMAFTPWITKNSSDFSPCSLQGFQEHLNAQKLTCLYNRPEKDGENLPKLMPGRMKNLDAQCRERYNRGSCQDKHPEISVCEKLHCYNNGDQCQEFGQGALDGTQCGSNNEFCLHQKCVSL